MHDGSFWLFTILNYFKFQSSIEVTKAFEKLIDTFTSILLFTCVSLQSKLRPLGFQNWIVNESKFDSNKFRRQLYDNSDF